MAKIIFFWPHEIRKNAVPNDETKEEDVEITTHKKRYISPEERQLIITPV